MNTITKLNNGILTAKISSLGAQLLSLNDGKIEYMWQADENVWNFTAPVLFPVCGGLNNGCYSYNGKTFEMPPHGFARFEEFEIENSTDIKACFLLKSNEGTKAKYPFDFEFRVIFELVEKKINITYSVTNVSDDKIYFSFGGHEGFACPEGVDEYSIKFENDTTLTRHMLKGGFIDGNTEEINLIDNNLKLDYKEFEKCTYIFRNINSDSVILLNNKGTRKLRIGFANHETLAIWTLPYRKYVCIEPWCGVSEKINFNGDITQKDGIVALDVCKSYDRTHFIEIM